MERLGKGYCVTGYYAGWDKKGIATQESCNDLCLSEAQCKYVAWYPNQTCSRYSGKYCVLNQDMNHVTFAKKYSGKIERFFRIFWYFVFIAMCIYNSRIQFNFFSDKDDYVERLETFISSMQNVILEQNRNINDLQTQIYDLRGNH